MKRNKQSKQQSSKRENQSTIVMVANQETWKIYLSLAIIVVISGIAFIPVFHNGFVWDDKKYILENPMLQSFNLKEIFSQNVMGNYHPLTMLTFAAEYHLFGLKEAGYHSVNLIFHLLNVMLVFYAVLLISDVAIVALVASLLFGIHPMLVESVAWASQLKDLLYTFFFLSSYIFYLKYLKDFQKKYLLFALGLFVFSLLSKAMAASLPVVLLLTDYFKGRKINGKAILEKVPFFLLALVFGIIAVMAQKESDAIQDIAVFSIQQRIVFASYSFITYLWKLLSPLQLSAYYPYPVKNATEIPLQYYAYLGFLIGFTASVIYSLRYTKKIFYGIGFFAITVFLVLQLLPVGGAMMADRYSYIPSIGIFYLAGEGFNVLWSKKYNLLAIGLLSAFVIFFFVKTRERCLVWKDEVSLWSNVIDQYQTISIAYYNRGIAFKNEKKYEQAIEDYDKAISLKETYADAYFNRGNIFLNSNKYDEALRDFSKAIEFKPDYVQAYNNLGIVYLNEKNFDQAINNYSKAIELKKDYADAYYNRGLAQYYLGKIEAACMDLKASVRYGYVPPADALKTICK